MTYLSIRRAGQIEARGRGMLQIARTCRTAGMPKPSLTYTPGDLRLEFVYSKSYLKTGFILSCPTGIDDRSYASSYRVSSRSRPPVNILAAADTFILNHYLLAPEQLEYLLEWDVRYGREKG